MGKQKRSNINDLYCPDCGGSHSLTVYWENTPPHSYCHKCEKSFYGEIDELEELCLNRKFLNMNNNNNNSNSNGDDNKKKKIKFVRGVINPLEERGITKETAKKFKVEKLFYKGVGCAYAFPYFSIENPKEMVAQKVKNISPKKLKVLGDIKNSLMFGMQAFQKGGKYITITEGEEDALACYQMLKNNSKYNIDPVVISVNHGAGTSAVKECKKFWHYIDSFENVIIAFDGDSIGKETAERVAKLFPAKARILHFNEIEKAPENSSKKWLLKDACDYLASGRAKDFCTMWYNAERYSPKGVRPFSSFWEDMVKVSSNLCVPFPWEGLNEMCGGMVTGKMDVFKAFPKVGKCFGKGTKVMMYKDSSFKAVEDIKVGDVLMGDDSTPRRVLTTIKGFDKDGLYLITYKNKFSKDFSFVCNSKHILSLRNKNDIHDKLDISVEDFLKDFKNISKDYKGYSVPILKDDTAIPWCPYYTLGKAYSGVSYDYVKELKSFIDRFNLDSSNLKSPHFVAISNKREKFKKEIRERFGNLILSSPLKKRLEFLAGFIDYKANIYHKNNTITYTFTSSLEDDLFLNRLIESCGFTLDTKKIYSGFTETFKMQTIYGDLYRIPSKRANTKVFKETLLRFSYKDFSNYDIEIKKIDAGEYYGFTLDGNNRFLLEHCIVAHNSTILSELLIHIHDTTEYNIGGFFLENTTKELGLKLCGIKMNEPLDRPTYNVNYTKVKPVYENLASDNRLIFFDPEDSRDADNILNKILYFVKAHNCKFIFLDHATMLAYTSTNTDERKFLDKLFADLKQLTTSLNIYLAVVVHVNDDGSTRGSRAPIQLCDRLYSLNRDKLNPDKIIANTTDFVVEDNRYGTEGLACQLYYDFETGRIIELDADSHQEKEVVFDD